jgi:hypothetical protein
MEEHVFNCVEGTTEKVSQFIVPQRSVKNEACVLMKKNSHRMAKALDNIYIYILFLKICYLSLLIGVLYKLILYYIKMRSSIRYRNSYP